MIWALRRRTVPPKSLHGNDEVRAHSMSIYSSTLHQLSVLQEIEVLICTKKSGPRETSQNVYDEHETGSLANRERF